MTDRKTFPHVVTNVRDDSIREIPPTTDRGLHNPVFIAFAESGPVNQPTLGALPKLQDIYGDKTFDVSSKYFNHPNLFAMYAGRYQNIWFVRVADADAKAASLVIEASVKQVSMIQYELDVMGNRVLDEDGDPVPVLSVDGVTPVTEPGIETTYAARALGPDESITNLLATTSMVGGVEVTTYPIMAVKGLSVGSSGNNLGFRLYMSEDTDTTAVESIKAELYRFEPVRLTEVSAIPNTIRDLYSNTYVDVSLKRDAIDRKTELTYDMETRLLSQYVTGSGVDARTTLPMSVHVYDNFIATIADRIKTVSPELADIDPWMINVLTGQTRTRQYYQHFQVTNASAFFHPNRVLYMRDGEDGDLSTETLEGLVAQYLNGGIGDGIRDNFRYPITHFYDSGFSLANKREIIKSLSVRRDIKLRLSTQDASLPPNTKDEDQSTGASLRGALLLHPESTVFGTPCMRASVIQHSGVLNDYPNLKFSVPASLDILVKICQAYARNYVTGELKGRPNSEVTMFKSVNWTPVSDDHKQLSWDTGLTYLQYGDTNVLFWPDLRSIYPIDNSLLSDDIFVDHLVYIMHIVQQKWTVYTGRSMDFALLRDDISMDIDKAINYAFNGSVPSTTNVYQTALDAARGYAWTVEVNVRGNMPNRVWNVIIPVNRVEG